MVRSGRPHGRAGRSKDQSRRGSVDFGKSEVGRVHEKTFREVSGLRIRETCRLRHPRTHRGNQEARVESRAPENVLQVRGGPAINFPASCLGNRKTPPRSSSELSRKISNSTSVSLMKPSGFTQAIFCSLLPHRSGVFLFPQKSARELIAGPWFYWGSVARRVLCRKGVSDVMIHLLWNGKKDLRI